MAEAPQAGPPDAPCSAALPADALGPLTWVQAELRRSLDTAAKCLYRYRREAEAADTPWHVPGLQHLLQAGQLLRQCAAALHMVGQPACAMLADAMHAAVQAFAEQRQPCTDEAVACIERAGFALTGYLDALLAARPAWPTELFTPYAEVQALAGAERAHPADLWPGGAAAAVDLPAPADVKPLADEPALRSRMDQAVLQLVKHNDPLAARSLHDVALGLAAGTEDAAPRNFWWLAAAYFEACALGLVPADVHGKRVASGVRTQFAAFARGGTRPADALVRALLFHCACAQAPADTQTVALQTVREAHALQGLGVPHPAPQRFGRMAPALLGQARKRIHAATETWAALVDGETHRLKTAVEQSTLVADALARVHADCAALTDALVQAAEAAWRAGGPPRAPLAQEVATALLFLDTTYAEPDASADQIGPRAQALAERLAQVLAGQEPQAPPPWLQAMHRAAVEREALACLATELGRTLAEVEAALDQFFRAPRERAVLGKVLAPLAQMASVFAVLELDTAARSTRAVHARVAQYAADPVDDGTARQASFARLGDNMAALAWMVGMLGHQPLLAQSLFHYDEDRDVLALRTDADRPALAAMADPPAAPAEAAPPADAGSAAVPCDECSEDAFRQIGPLRVALPQYNAFLNDADEWSRQLQTEVGEWALQQPAPPAESSALLAQALADGAAALGFAPLAELAGLLAQVLDGLRTQTIPQAQVQPVLDGVEEMRRLLHQFAAGFLKPARDDVVPALRALLSDAAPAPAEDGTASLDADLLAILQDEAAERMPALMAQLQHWQQAPDDAGLRQQVLRTLHTLKGGARLAGALQLGAQAHALEDAVLRTAPAHATPQQVASLAAQAERLQESLDALCAAGAPLQSESESETGAASPQADAPLWDAHARAGAQLAALDQVADMLRDKLVLLRQQLHQRAAESIAGDAPDAAGPLAQRCVEDMALLKDGVADMRQALAELQQQLTGLHGPAPHAPRSGLDALARRLRMLTQHCAAQAGHEARLQFATDGPWPQERALLDRLAPLLDHLVRNAVAHGIEDTSARQAAGKPAAGTVAVTLAQTPDGLRATVRDDGRGLDLARIAQRAQAQGLLADGAEPTQAQAADLVLRPGFSTWDEAEPLAGRGIGLDAVEAGARALGGRLAIDSTPGQGSSFTLLLPRPQSTA